MSIQEDDNGGSGFLGREVYVEREKSYNWAW